MHWIYLSPHLDDAVFSCGGLIWQQTHNGDPVEIWTLCAGDPPDPVFSPFAQELHDRWQAGEQGVAERRREDIHACSVVGALPRHFPLPDCIYRRPAMDYWKPPSGQASSDHEAITFLYPDREAIFGLLHPMDLGLLDETAKHLSGLLPPGARLVSPLTLGGHVDHQLARRVAERLVPSPWYYADYPYAADHFAEIPDYLPDGWRKQAVPLSTPALDAWAAAMAAYRSQISSFWPDALRMRSALESYTQQSGGCALWSPASDSNIVGGF